jgi:peptidyl-prolyl cis-trans isomerase D
MTMLDRMRRHKSWLKWTLALVVAAFILLYVPSFLSPTSTTGAAPTDVVATVDGRRITANTYQQLYTQQLAQIQASYGAISQEMLTQLQIGPRLLQQLVNQEAVVAEAERRGITVSDGELRERILRMPAFQENGQFVGQERYRLILDSARPPVRPEAFEAEMRRSLLSEKLQAAVTGWIRLNDADVEEEYRRRNEQVRLELAIFRASEFEEGITPTEEAIVAEFEARPDLYRVPEKRRVSYISIDATALRDTMSVTPQEVEARYRANASAYSTPEQVRASHILLTTEGKDEAAVRSTAEGLLAQVRGGGDFAALAREHSEDEQSAIQGGDLGFFSRGQMVAEFDAATWALEPGEVSDLVQTQYGFHIIRTDEKRPAVTRTLDQVRAEIDMAIKTEKAQAEARRLALELAEEIDSSEDLTREAQERGLVVGDSGLFARDEPLAGLGYAPEVAAEAFGLEQGAVSEQLPTSQGYALIAVQEVVPAAMPPLDTVRDQVRQNVVQARAVEVAAERAAEMAERTAGTSFAAAAEAAGVDVTTTELITRGAALPEIGVSAKVDQAAFTLAEGETSDPIETGSAVVVLRVAEKQDIDPAGLETARDALRAELAEERRSSFFTAYMQKAMDDMDIEYNQRTVAALLGP